MRAPAQTTDVVVVGAGAAGLYAAARLAEAGRTVVLLEASRLFGGSTGSDTGQLWLPATRLAAKLGGADTPEAALEYLNAALGPTRPSSSPERRRAFVETADAVAGWLDGHKFALAPVRGRVDFHPDAPKARRGGRVLAAADFDRRSLGPLAKSLRQTDSDLEIAPRSVRGAAVAAGVVLRRIFHPRRDMVTAGAALCGRLLGLASAGGVSLVPDTALTGLLLKDGRVVGVQARAAGVDLEYQATLGVLLACGGFEANADLRQAYLPKPTETAWTTGLATNTGEGLRAALAAGAATAELDNAWWTIVARFGGHTFRMTSERSLPHGILVDSAGDRFFDEAGPTTEAGRALYTRSRRVGAVPSYLVVDNRHRQRYRMGPWAPGSGPASDEDEMARAQSVADLAGQLSIDQAGLIGTVVRFNGLAAKGRDSDFGRGASPVDRANGDPTYRRNPCLGALEKSPFWAVRVYPGDAGTKGGVLTDADARVLTDSGEAIPGLFAVAGTSASLFTDTAPGPGAATASALVDAHRAVDRLLDGEVPASPA